MTLLNTEAQTAQTPARTKLSEELTRLGLTRYCHLSDREAVALAHDDLVIPKEEVIQALLQEIEETGETSSPSSLDDLRRNHIKDRDALTFRMNAVDVLFHAAKFCRRWITEECLADCDVEFLGLNDASQIRLIQIYEILGLSDRLEFLIYLRDLKNRPNAVELVDKNGKFVERRYRDDNQPDPLRDAAVQAIKTLKSPREFHRQQQLRPS
jgi:hypothetical protein